MDGRTILAARAGCPRIVPVLSSLAARIAEAKRRPREAQFPPRKRLIVRGVVPATTQSDLPPMRATARLVPEGQCPSGGGDARRRRKTERGRFGANSFGTEPPRSVLGGVSRPRRPRPRGKSVRNAKHTSTADEHTLKGDRPRRGRIEAQSKAREGQPTRRGRGWKSQSRPLEERGRTTQRPRAEDIPLAEGEPEGRTSGGATHNSADFGDYSRTRPSARGKRNWQGV